MSILFKGKLQYFKENDIMKKTIMVLMLGMILLLTGCASMLEEMVKVPTASSSAPKKVSSDPLDGYVMAYIAGSPGDYRVATVIKPATDASKGESEVILAYNNDKVWTKVFTSHPAAESELAVGEVVLVEGTGFSDPDKQSLIDTIWGAAYITNTSNLYKGEVQVGSLSVSTKNLRIPDTEIATQ